MYFLFRSLLIFLFLFLSSAEGAFKNPPLTVEILQEEETLQPNHPFLLATHFKIDEGWHIYWKNPGEAGMAPSITWELPQGFKKGVDQWPTPEKFDLSGLVGFGYEGEMTLLTPFIPPEASQLSSETVTIKGKIDWLVCSSTQCEPGSKIIELVMRVGSQTPKKIEAHRSLFEKAKTSLPLDSGVIRTKLSSRGEFQIEVAADSIKGNGKKLTNALFFPEEEGIVDLDDVPRLESKGNSYLITFKALQGEKSELLKGVLLLYEDNNQQKGVAFEIQTSIDKEENSQLIGMVLTPLKEGQSLQKQKVVDSKNSFEGGLELALFFAFLGGILLNLMPCVLPVISFKVMSFVKMAREDRKLTLKHGLFFCLGVVISFWILASIMLILRSYGQTVGWGFQLQEPRFIIVLASLLFLFALSLFGVFEWGLFVSSWAGQTEHEQTNKSSGFLSSFFSGVLATAVATPCTGPFLGSAVGFAVTLPFLQALSIFTSLAIGMCSPYLLLAAYPSLLRFLPKPGAWMDTFKQLMGFMLLATVLWLLWVFSAQTNTFSLVCFLAGLLFFSFAAWIYGQGTMPLTSKRKRYLAYAISLLFLWGGFQTILYPSATWNEEESVGRSQGGSQWKGWEKFSPELIAKLQAEKTPFIIDFTAKWCLICQANHLILASEEIEREFTTKGFVKVIADWTKNDPAITEALSQYGRNSVPLYVIHGGDPEVTPLILPQVLTKDVILDHIEQLLPKDEIAAGED